MMNNSYTYREIKLPFRMREGERVCDDGGSGEARAGAGASSTGGGGNRGGGGGGVGCGRVRTL